jgi:hypothetical protein
MSDVLTMNNGSTAIVHSDVLELTPIGYPDGASIRYGNKLLYQATKTIRDADMRVFLCILKAYTDNRYDAIVRTKEEASITSVDSFEVASFRVDVSQISNIAYGQRARGTRLLEAMERIAGLKIHLLNDKGEAVGFVNIVAGVELSKDRKSLKIGINKRFLIDMSKKLVSYNFDKLISLNGLDFRLYMVMQGRKYKSGKNKYCYTNIDDKRLRLALNSDNPNTKAKIAKSFENIGINFTLGNNGKWDYPQKNDRQKVCNFGE